LRRAANAITAGTHVVARLAEAPEEGRVVMSRLKAVEAALVEVQRRLASLEQWHRRGRSPRIPPLELERARKRAGWTMVEAARACGVAQSTWCRWENGENLCAGDTALTVIGEFRAAGVDPPAAVE